MTFSRPPALLLLVLLGASPACALEWSATTLEARAEPFQKTLTLVFKFKNDGAKPAHLLDLQTSCSCLAAQTAILAVAAQHAAGDARPGTSRTTW